MVEIPDVWKRYVVTWYCNGVKPSRSSRHVIDLALCGYSGGVAFFAVYDPHAPLTEEVLKPLIITDVIIGGDVCEDGRWCLNLDCPLNRADMRYFRKHGVKNRKALENLHAVFERIRRELGLKIGKPGHLKVFEKPVVYLKILRKEAHASSLRRRLMEEVHND